MLLENNVNIDLLQFDIAAVTGLAFVALSSFYATSSFNGMVPIFDVDTVDTTGCGDSFMSAFLAFLSGKDFKKLILNENEIKEIAVKAAAASSITLLRIFQNAELFFLSLHLNR
jgi:sugar/nucleoside kinase (ribokinase family)